MSSKLKNLILIIVPAVVVFLFAPFFGGLYERIIGRQISSGFWGLSNPEYFEGFFVSYAFFVTLVIVLFSKSKKYEILGYFLGILFLLNIVSNTWESLVINLGFAIVSFVLAQIILFIYKKFKK